MAQTINVDISTRGAPPVAYTHQGDTDRTFLVNVFENGAAFGVAGFTVKVAAILPSDNGYTVITGADMVSATKTTTGTNQLMFTPSAQYTARSGRGILTLIMTTNTGTPATIRPINIDFRIQKSADGDNVIAGASDFPEGLEEIAESVFQEYLSTYLPPVAPSSSAAANKAADAKLTGEALDDLKSDLSNNQIVVSKFHVEANTYHNPSNDKLNVNIKAGETYIISISFTQKKSYRLWTYFDDNTNSSSEYMTSENYNRELTATKNIVGIGIDVARAGDFVGNDADIYAVVYQTPVGLDISKSIGEINEISEIVNIAKENISWFDHAKTFSTIANQHAFALSTPIKAGALINSFTINMRSGSVDYYLANITDGIAKSYFHSSFEAQTEGIYVVPIGIMADGETYLFIQGSNVIKYSTNSANGKLNNPIIEVSDTTNLDTTGAVVSYNTASFVYPVDMDVYNFAPEVINAETEPGYVLNVGNILKYVKNENDIVYFGRWFDYELNGHTYKATNNDGAQIFVKTKGAASLSLVFRQITEQAIYPYIAYSVDGSEYVRSQILGTISIPLTNTENNDEHYIRIVVDGMTEAQGGNKWLGTIGVYLQSISVDTGSMVGITPRNRVGMFFGDSITEGINALATGATAETNSASNAFPFFCSKILSAVPFVVGYGGSGLLVNGSFQKAIKTINYIKDGLSVGDYCPDFICLNYGVNDYYASQTSANFKTALINVVERLGVLYPGVPVFIVSPFKTTAYDSVENEVAQMYAQCYFISSSTWNGETTDGTHLSVVGAENNGTLLAEAIIKILGKEFFI